MPEVAGNANRGTFADRLRHHRLEAGLTQEVLAERAGLSMYGVQKLERGATHPYRDTAQRLATALQLAPDERARFLAAVVPVRRRGSAPTIATDDERRDNLPRQLTSFVGRQQDVASVAGLLANSRLLTLTGTGGVGKSRLALEVADRLSDRFPDGVWLVELAPLSDPALVPDAVLAAMAIPQQPGRSALDSLLVSLRTRQVLVLLDNCEHLLEACATLTEALLRTCPHVRVLATSREPLAIAGETRWQVPALSLPAADQLASLESVTACEAVQLFLDRVRGVQPGFSLTTANGPLVAGICIQLDGIPLALELAAARLSALGVADLAARLDQRFRLLTGGSRSSLPRQQTLEATVTWSYDLLSPGERSLFARLSVFARGWTLAAAEAVAADESITPADVLNLLSQLVDKSLVVAEPLNDGTTWYRLLETMRQYGWQQLTLAGEAATVQRRHALFYLELSERADLALIGPNGLHWFDRLEREHDNLRAVLAWCLVEREPADDQDLSRPLDIGLRIAGNLRFFWIFHDHYREELAWLDQALARGRANPRNVRARALITAGVLAGFMNDLTRSRAMLAESAALCRELGEQGELSVALSTLGWALWRSGEERPAAAALEEGLAQARAVGERWRIAFALMHDIIRVASTAAIECARARAHARAGGSEALRIFRAGGNVMRAVVEEHLGQIAVYEADHARAQAAFTASLPTLRALGWRSEVAATLVRLGGVCHARGNDAEAASRYTEALALYSQLGDQWLPAVALVHARLAALAFGRSDAGRADHHVTESLKIAQGTGLERALPFAETPIPDALEVRAALAAAQGASGLALRLAGAAAALRVQCHQALATADGVRLQERLAPAGSTLTADQQAQAWAQGERMTVEEAIAAALHEA